MILSRPWALLFLAAVPALAALFAAAFRRKRRLFRSIGDPKVLSRLTDPLAPRRQGIKAVLAIATAGLLALALAGPRWGQTFQEARRRGVDVVIAVDVSASMLAEDVAPNRLTQAKRELGLLIAGLEGDRVGLVAFAGAAFLQCPLTLDYAAARTLLDLVAPDLIPAPGTNIAAALDRAVEAYPAGSTKHRALVLLTDGEDHSRRLAEAVQRAQKEGVRIFAVGFGRPEGEIIPLRDEQGNLREYKKDRSGQTVVSRLGESDLQDMASRTGGRYYRASQGEIEVEKILADIDGMEKKTLEDRIQDRAADRYQLPLALALLLLLLEFLWPEVGGHWGRILGLARKAKPAAALITTVLLVGRASGAGRAPKPEDYARAAEELRAAAEARPSDPEARFTVGQALYRAGDFPAAQNAFETARGLFQDPVRKADGAYNAGNALIRQNKPAEALEKYKEALRLNPTDADAKHNLEIAAKLLKEKNSGGQGKPQPQEQKDDQNKDGRDGGAAPRPASANPGQMSREDAERILQAIERQEKDARKKTKAPKTETPAAEQDW